MIRAANLQDVAGLQSLLGELGYDIQAGALEEQVRGYLQSSRSRILVAEGPDGALVGLISGHAIPLIHRPGRLGRITALVVSEGARAAGIGRRLVAELEGWFEGQGCVKYEVTSGDHRPPAHAFYRALGYAADERRFVKNASSDK